MRDVIQKEVSTCIVDNNFEGIIDVAPRVGKSKIIIDSLKEFNGTVLITVPYNIIIDSWNSELKKWNKNKKIKFTILNQRSIPEDIEKFDLVICDEIHSLSENQIQKLKKAVKILGASGSISSVTKHTLYTELGLKEIYEYSISRAINDKIISNFVINLVPCSLSKTKEVLVKTKNKDYYQSEYARYQSVSKYFAKCAAIADESYGTKDHFRHKRAKMSAAGFRANFIYSAPTKIELAQEIIGTRDRSLIFTARTSVADILGNPHHGKSNKNNFSNFVSEKINTLSSVKMIQMGVTIPNLKVGIFHQIQSNDESAVQKVLRMCNLEDQKLAEIFICYYEDTVDERWVTSSLKMFDSSHIKYIR